MKPTFKLRLPVYLDYNSTTPADSRVVDKMLPFLRHKFGNPASRSHILGWEAEAAVEKAREFVASLIKASSKEIVWTSGATESNNLAIKTIALSNLNKGRHVITLKTEHKAVLDTCRYLESKGFIVSYLAVNNNGLLDLNLLNKCIQPDTILVVIMYVNHEIGVIQNIESISSLCSSYGIPLHVDAAQAVGKVSINTSKTQINTMSLTSHKAYGPKGVGALYVNKANVFKIEPQMHGGGQEKGVRSGTLPTHQIVGMGEAYRLIYNEGLSEFKTTKQLNVHLVKELVSIVQVNVNGSLTSRIPHNININIKYVEGEALMMSMKNVCVSSGSACTSSALQPSYILQAIGCIQNVHNSIRFSLGRFTLASEVEYVSQAVIEKIKRLRQLSPLWS
ncbi:aminotransferase class V-fold PLP-dependent enzyme [Candidatus Tremblaya phenacola]|uniref:aminotransferase class V-fold PLP-dependent enzyme n=1 Tax=Candidatus Tremblayella phenacoccinincola TaxID=1010676 RepID=UPI0013301FFC|nr:aminotransferase class V-fold PLP-dependent enzyme [Candidatus Tremblaya phenacola]KAH0998365.1 Cysteine desulfurase > IscS [Candidatus Tremblaya phenacola]